jgi:DNA-binding NarL/FixJ family response regulator
VPAPSSLGVVLVEPLRLVRAGLSLLISDQSDMAVVAEVSDASATSATLEAIRLTPRRKRMIALVSLTLPGPKDSFWLIRAIREQFPSLPILVCGGADPDSMTVSRALFAGADGFVHKNAEPLTFLDAIRRSGRGELVLEGLPMGSLGEIADGVEVQRTAEQVLTSREREVLEVAAEGLTARQIGRRLGVEERTVTTHLSRIYKKLGTPGRVAALTLATREGMLSAAVFE